VYFGRAGSTAGTEFGAVDGGSGTGERIEAIAWNSACRVPLRVRFVAFMPRAMMVLLCTKTQPTGVSSVSRASWACFVLVDYFMYIHILDAREEVEGRREKTNHSQSLLHEAFMNRSFF